MKRRAAPTTGTFNPAPGTFNPAPGTFNPAPRATAGPPTHLAPPRPPGPAPAVHELSDELPRKPLGPPRHRRTVRRESVPPAPRWRVLLVEDDTSAATALRGVLTRRGWSVTIAGTVSLAIDALARPPHCVVLDLMLPDGSGVEVLSRVRATGQPIRVVVTTGVLDVAELKQVRQFEPDAVLRKPIDIGDLLDALGPCVRE